MNIRSLTAPNPGPFTLDGTRTYLLGESAVIDPGPAIESHVRAIIESMPTVDRILITHRHADHAPAAIPLKEATGARIFAPEGVLDDAHVDHRVSDGEFINVEGTPVEVIATPGHTREHVCYLTASGDLFTGDTILGFGTTAIFPPDGNMREYIDSLRLLRWRDPKRIWPAHGPTRDDAIALIDEYIEHRLAREQQIVAAFAAGARTPAAIRQRIYGDLDERLHRAAEIQVEAHLIKLREEGRLP
ncbi:MAG TPA: MBL fold metallo-hydrolase [Thermoanaerobaculia bacterium]|nr:MBL fold metallo-hydrolase [Thermoanaerobaculia bacterium]